MARKKLKFVLGWHMHQPHYREGENGPYHLPWVYLHALKDYTDMAAHFENEPAMRAVVNFAPTLLEQLDDYAQQIDALINKQQPCADELINLVAGHSVIPDDIDARRKIISDCQRCHAPQLIEPYPAFAGLISKLGEDSSNPSDELVAQLDQQFFVDLLVWYHIAWLGESLKGHPTAVALMAKQSDFDSSDQTALITLMYDAIDGIIPRYKKLAESGQVELSMTPYAHPIVPLLNDFENMQCAQPEAPRPSESHYPDGNARNHWHMREGLDTYRHYFDATPTGVWLSEGGISDDALDVLTEYDIKWTASGQGVWGNTCHRSDIDKESIYNKKALFSPFKLNDLDINVFFRDDGLSDFIGFEYSHWDAQQAANDFVKHLENIHGFLGDNVDEHVISVVLDGENAWEYYPHNGSHFLSKLYQKLANHPLIEATTFADVCSDTVIKPITVNQLCAGSWVYGSFSTWIGQDDKNRAWDYIVAAKRAFDEVVATNTLSKDILKQTERQLAICEGSDWFWWFGDYNSSDSVRDFDLLFRTQLKRLYTLLGKASPDYLNQPISVGGGDAENSGTMQRGVN
jgi:alpha-amylase/alpha-mannosidase (GH57 family)